MLAKRIKFVFYRKEKEKHKKQVAKLQQKKHSVRISIKLKPSLAWRRIKLAQLVDEMFAGVYQIKFTYADMHRNMKVMLKSPIQRKYVLHIHTENDIANILSRLDCKYERLGEIYPSDDKWWL